MAYAFRDRLLHLQDERRSLLCIGLDPDPRRLPPHLTGRFSGVEAAYRFCSDIVDATQHLACAYKINFAFFEAMGSEGIRLLERLIPEIRRETPVIADAKRGDIGNSARMYAEALFERLDVDACTVAPYMGRDSIEPFLAYPGKAAFVLARTSNSGSADFQHLLVDSEPLYSMVARRINEWQREQPGEAGLVVGATDPAAMSRLRAMCPSLPFLIPGVGAQGGDAGAAIAAALTPHGPVVINSSRSILYASAGDDFAAAAGRAAEELRSALQRHRTRV